MNSRLQLKKSFTEMHLAVIAMLSFVVLTHLYHSKGISWDFCAYKLVGNYLLGKGYYFELFRPPVPSLLIAILHEHAYFLLSHVLLLLAVILFSRKQKLDSVLFYLLLMTPFAVMLMVSEGSEILAIALFLFALSFADSWKGAAFLAMTCLTRYTFLWMLPFFVLYSLTHYRHNRRLAVYHAVAFFSALMPWLIYNWVEFGHPLASILDSYLLNVYSRMDMIEKISLIHVLAVGVPTIFFAVPRKRAHATWMFMFFLFFLSVYFTPTKLFRYYLPLVLPLAIIAADNLSSLSIAFKRVLSIFFLAFTLVVSIVHIYPGVELEDPAVYSAAKKLVDGCNTVSNGWVVLNCIGVRSYPIRHESDYLEMLNAGYIGVVFDHIKQPEYARKLELYSGFNTTLYDGFMLINGAGCNKSKENIILIYLKEYNIRTGKNLSYNDLMLSMLSGRYEGQA